MEISFICKASQPTASAIEPHCHSCSFASNAEENKMETTSFRLRMGRRNTGQSNFFLYEGKEEAVRRAGLVGILVAPG